MTKVRKNLKLRVISAFVITTLSWNSAYATDTQQSSNTVDSNNVIVLKNGMFQFLNYAK